MTVAPETRPSADPKAHSPFSFWQYDLSDDHCRKISLFCAVADVCGLDRLALFWAQTSYARQIQKEHGCDAPCRYIL
ncbi:hypothetical protein IG631_09894 [Alternaria alternata]|nr:hypothetical protein IG631_09894 [Alternaria alternata]